MSTLLQHTVGEIVAENPRTSIVFERYGIDYCCAGKIKFAEACARRGVDQSTVAAAIESLQAAGKDDQVSWNDRPLTELADHIEATHHAELRTNLPRIAGLLERVVNAHGQKDRRLGELQNVVRILSADMYAHMQKEEVILFPLIRQMESGELTNAGHCGSIANPIRVMESEHDSAGSALAQVRTLTDEFTAPASACNTYRALIDALHELEEDMHVHVHKENSILFPRAIALEQSVSLAIA